MIARQRPHPFPEIRIDLDGRRRAVALDRALAGHSDRLDSGGGLGRAEPLEKGTRPVAGVGDLHCRGVDRHEQIALCAGLVGVVGVGHRPPHRGTHEPAGHDLDRDRQSRSLCAAERPDRAVESGRRIGRRLAVGVQRDALGERFARCSTVLYGAARDRRGRHIEIERRVGREPDRDRVRPEDRLAPAVGRHGRLGVRHPDPDVARTPELVGVAARHPEVVRVVDADAADTVLVGPVHRHNGRLAPRPQFDSTLWTWTYSPADMSSLALPMLFPYFRTIPPFESFSMASLCPNLTSSVTSMRRSSSLTATTTVSPASTSRIAVVTLSAGSTTYR